MNTVIDSSEWNKAFSRILEHEAWENAVVDLARDAVSEWANSNECAENRLDKVMRDLEELLQKE